MKYTTTNDGWHIPMDGGSIQRIEVDFRLGLHFSDKVDTGHLYIESPCYLIDNKETTLLVPAIATSVAPILSLFNAEVVEVTILKTGHLSVMFSLGRSLTIAPDPAYEAWQIGCMNFLIVCNPGGEVSVFLEPAVK